MSAFIAQYYGTCAACWGSIRPGEEVVYNAADELVHVECPEAVEGPSRPACSRCHLVHAGECF